MRHLFPPLRFPMAVYPGYPASPAQAFSPPHLAHSTGQTRRSKNHQANQMVFRSFRCARYCGESEQVGAFGDDTGRNVVADIQQQGDRAGIAAVGGALYHDNGRYTNIAAASQDGLIPYHFSFDASRIWGDLHIGSEFAPTHYKQPVALYLGRTAQI